MESYRLRKKEPPLSKHGLQMLDMKFDNLRVRDDESFSDFYARLCKFNTLHVPLGEKY